MRTPHTPTFTYFPPHTRTQLQISLTTNGSTWGIPQSAAFYTGRLKQTLTNALTRHTRAH